ncbi:DUF2158 domain-containing protein [Serratia sp. K-E0102]|uniref:YodC family protein n=1 Tax=Serratia TaxID=613 RepID=UPI0007454074|nr:MULTISPECIES: DUF2158 domain-containing protein [Serratia]WGZ69722.1 DUF2158 domain-containing protein [Serratia sp. K-E0102]CUZ48141.1 Uncharacterized small protein [Serratia marcescens]
MTTKNNQPTKPIYKKGDIVYLLTGGPSMTISEAIFNISDKFVGAYKCQWFAGKKLENGRFEEETLTSTNPKP